MVDGWWWPDSVVPVPIALQGDGKVVVVGTASTWQGGFYTTSAVVAGSTEMYMEPVGIYNIADSESAAYEATAISYMYQRGMDLDPASRRGVYSLSQLCPHFGKAARSRFYALMVPVLSERCDAVQALSRQLSRTPGHRRD